MNFTVDQVLTSLCADMSSVLKQTKKLRKVSIATGIAVGVLYFAQKREIEKLKARVSQLEGVEVEVDGGYDYAGETHEE